MACCTRSSSHTVAAWRGCANIPRPAGGPRRPGPFFRSVQLWEQPGNLKFLYWISRGNLGSYLDAISFGEAIGESPSTAAVRMQPTKDGVGLNFAQQIPPDFGVLSRVGVSRGTVEAIDLPDINRSISGGLSLTGSRWGRPDDTFGLAGAINRISHQGKLYLAAGGLGGIIGDGQLPNAGREQILETF